MAVDKNLFLHDLTVVAILKNEAPYLKEWLDYHLLAGVDHFYLYDNDSPDNQAEVAAPYVKAGLVDYFRMPGIVMQMVAYNDALNRFKFQTRYMAFIDGDEFICPKKPEGIVTVVDDVLSRDSNAAGLAINWQLYGSNNHETADYSRGVLERFTRRAPKSWRERIPLGIIGGNIHVKTITVPRAVNFIGQPHYPVYFEGFYSVNENGKFVKKHDNDPVTVERILINHYFTKSREEFSLKQRRIRSDVLGDYDDAWFNIYNRNEEFDDGILRYRAERAKVYQPPDKSQSDERLCNALIKNLSAFASDVELDDKMETALTCRAVATYLRGQFPDDERLKIFEEASLAAILKSIDGAKLSDAQLFLSELPNLLELSYPVVKDLHIVCLQFIPQLMNIFHLKNMWRDYAELNYLQRLLKNFGEWQRDVASNGRD